MVPLICVLLLFFLNCASVNEQDMALLYDSSDSKDSGESMVNQEWAHILGEVEKEIQSIEGSKQLKLRLMKEDCAFGEKSCKFIARSFEDGRVDIFPGVLKSIDEKINLTKHYILNKNYYRKNYLTPIVLHEVCHIKLNHHAAQKNILRESKILKAYKMRNMELEADSCSLDILKHLGYKEEYSLLTLELLKELYQKRNQRIENRVDYLDYSHLHPSPNTRLSHLSGKLASEKQELYENLAALEKIFSEIRLARSQGERDILKKNIITLDRFIGKYQKEDSLARAELKMAKAIALHKLWVLENHPEILGFHGVIVLPLFSDAPDYTSYKGDAQAEELYEAALRSYISLFEEKSVENFENYPSLLSTYGLLLSYSKLNPEKKKSLEFTTKAWSLEKNFTTGTNYGIVLFQLGFTKKAEDIFNVLWAKKISYRSDVYPVFESHLYENAERTISQINYSLFRVKTNAKSFKLSDPSEFQAQKNTNPWVSYIKSFL